MGWETRERGSLFYTRSKRIKGKIVREYIGKGPAAEIIAEEDRQLREEKHLQRENRNKEEQRLKELDNRVKDLYDQIEVLVRLSYESTGYYCHKRGEWRKSVHKKRQDPNNQTQKSRILHEENTKELVSRAQNGDEWALAILKKKLDDPELWRNMGNLPRKVEALMLQEGIIFARF